jgi:hypothetical protein
MTDMLTDADREHFDRVARQCARIVIGLVSRSIYIELVDRIADALAEEIRVHKGQLHHE